MAKSLVVFSGGMDSVYALFEARKQGEAEALFFDYSQRHYEAEYNAASYICSHLSVPLHITWLGDILKSKSVLTDNSIQLDQYKDYAEAEKKLKGKIEPAFVPMRNSMFMVVAANRAVVDDFNIVYLGIAKEDGDTVPDCTNNFLENMETAIDISLDNLGPGFRSPLLRIGKVRGIQNALKNLPGCYAAWAFSHTSYAGDYPPISRDHASVCREDAFNKAKVPDPLIMRAYLNDLSFYPSNTEVYLRWQIAMETWKNKWYNDKTYKAFEDLESIVKLGV